MIVVAKTFKLCACEDRCRCLTPSVPYESYVPSYQKILDCLRPGVVREWGPGRNTAMALDAGAEVFSTESEPQYLFAHHPKLVQCYVGVGNDAYTDAWVAADVFFVDGRRRAHCIARVHEDAPGLHVLVLHDANRCRYWGALDLYKYVLVAEGGTAFATDDQKQFGWLGNALRTHEPVMNYTDWQNIPVAERR